MEKKNEVMRMSATEIMSMAKAFKESGMFPDIKHEAQAVVKIQAGAEMGIPAFASMNGIHIIQGKATVGAGLMASMVKGSGKYDYKVLEHSDKACSIDFYEGKNKIGNSTFTLDDAKKAGTKNMDKHPKNMLFARAMSNGTKWYCADVFNGPVYVPEEMETVTEDVPHTVVEDTVPEYDRNALGQEILNCKLEDELKAVWEKYPDLHKDRTFINTVNARKEEILSFKKEAAK